VKKYFEKKKQEKSSMSKEEKDKLKKAREQNEIGLKYAIVDQILERVSNFRIEPRTLFKGRGEHPKAGTLKPKIFPEDVHINLSQCSQVPLCLKPGHCWGSVVFEKKTTWLSSYAADGGHKKYVFLGAGSKMKGQNDVKKYEKARELKKKILEVKANYTEKMNSTNKKHQMLGTATYLIDTLAIRVGNEKNDDEADTVGCCSLRKEHLTFKENNTLVLDFYGKDSMRFKKESKYLIRR
jgi:DNA topoisomerase-1